MEWVVVADTPPPVGVQILVYVNMHPAKWEDSYAGLVDGSDRSKEELERRSYAREFIYKNPIQIATPYNAFGGLKYMIRSNSDSTQGFIGDNEVLFWCKIPVI